MLTVTTQIIIMIEEGQSGIAGLRKKRSPEEEGYDRYETHSNY